MDDKIKKLTDLSELYKSNSITKEEYDLLKSELLNDSNKKVENVNDISIKPKIERNIFEETQSQNNYRMEDNRYNYEEMRKAFYRKITIMILVVVGGIFLFVNIISGTFSKKTDPIKESIENSSINGNSVNNTNETWTCNICGRKITGRGYSEVSDGVWQPCEEPYQGQICSPACGRIESQRTNQKYNAILAKHGYAPIDFDSKSSTTSHAQPNRNGFFTGSDGQLHQSSPCDNCHHTGFINMGDGMQVCPMCNGKGEIIH